MLIMIQILLMINIKSRYLIEHKNIEIITSIKSRQRHNHVQMMLIIKLVFNDFNYKLKIR